MTAFVTRNDNNLGVGRIFTSPTAYALYENLFAFAEGSAGAPRIQTAAIDNAQVTTVKLAENERISSSTVMPIIAGQSLGAVGTWAIANRSSAGTIAQGATVAGSGLKYHAVTNVTLGSTLSGTWRNMGAQITDNQTALFLRIS